MTEAQRAQKLEAALRHACVVSTNHGDVIAYRTANGIPMDMPAKVKRMVKEALGE